MVPARLFAVLVQHAAAAAPSSLPQDELERFPPWLANHVAPVLEANDDMIMKAQAVLQFGLATNAQGLPEVEFKVDDEGLRHLEGLARPKGASRVVAVMGRRGAGKSFLCRKLVEGSVLAAKKSQVCVCARASLCVCWCVCVC